MDFKYNVWITNRELEQWTCFELMNRVWFLGKLFESHHFCLYLRHIWVLLTSLLHCQTWKCKKSLDRKNKFTSKILFFSPCANMTSFLRIWSQGLHEGPHPKSSQNSKILTTSEAKKDLSSVLSPKKYGKSWGKKSLTFEAPETQLSRFLIKLR